MARLFSLIALALVGQALCNPTPQLPEKYLGTYESVPENDQNFAEFASIFKLPGHVSWTKPNTFFLYHDGTKYVTRLVFSPYVPPFDLSFQLGETATTTINGRNVEYVYTVENGDSESPVLKAKFRDSTENEKKFTVDAKFTPTGIEATYVREGVTAKRTYRRVATPNAAGFYENVPEKQSPNFLEFAQRVMPAPNGLTWDSKTGVWLGRYGKDFVIKYIITPTVNVAFPFQFNEPRTIELNGRKITYTYTVVSEDYKTRTLTIRGEFKSDQGTLTSTAVITPEGVSVTYKSADQTASRYYKRVLNPLVYGIYESVPQFTENWSEFIKPTGMRDDSAEKTKIFVFPKSENEVYYRYQYENGQGESFPFTLNKTLTTTTHNGKTKTYTYNERPSYSNDVYIAGTYEVDGHKGTVDLTFNTSGLRVVYRAGNVVATRYYRRVLPAAVLGKFESQPDTPEFVQFAQTIGKPELTKKTTIEFTKTPEGTYQQVFNVEGTPAVTVPFTLGEKAKTQKDTEEWWYVYNVWNVYKNPVVSTNWWTTTPNTKFTVTAEYTPTGYTAYYLANGRLATRTYNRVGAPVPLETLPATA
jgi:hypothetical protein